MEYNCKAPKGGCPVCFDYSRYRGRNRAILSPKQQREAEIRRKSVGCKAQKSKSKIGKSSKRNGWRTENITKNMFESWGLEAGKIVASGALKHQQFITREGDTGVDVLKASDLWVKIKGVTYQVEVKRRENCSPWHNKLIPIMEKGKHGMYVDGFCYITPQHIFEEFIQGARDSIEFGLTPDKGFNKMKGFFTQDNADIVIVYKPGFPMLFCIKQEVMERLGLGANISD